MKILLITDDFLPQLGGVERHVYTLVNFLQSKNIDTTILTSTIQKHEIDSRFKIKRTLGLVKRETAVHWPYTFKKNSEILRDTINSVKDQYDLVHYHGTHNLFIDAVDPKIKTLTTLHGILPACISFWGITKWCGEKPSAYKCAICTAKIRNAYIPLIPGMAAYSSYFYNKMKKSMKRYNKIFAVSNFVENVVKNAYDLNNISTVYNFIDVENDVNKQLAKKSKINLDYENKQILLYSGRLDKQKGIHVLLDSYKKIKEEYKNTELIITGKGDLENSVKKHSEKNSSVRYLGFLERNEQMAILNKSSVFLAPSVYPDACPTTILEAMSLGKPVVSTNVGGIPELIIDGKTGYIVMPESQTDFIEGVKKVLANGPETYSEACIKQAMTFDISNVGKEIMDNYEKLSKLLT